MTSTRNIWCCLAGVAVISFVALVLSATDVFAHASEQAIVLLLPTGVYSAAGVVAVALTVVIFSLMPERMATGLFSVNDGPGIDQTNSVGWTSLLSTAVLFFLIWIGWAGNRDPLENLLVLTIWTGWWIGFVSLQLIVGDLWRFINPWTGFYRLLFGQSSSERMIALPNRLGQWPAVLIFLLFGAFYLAYPAPDDPAHLALVVGGYWLFTFAAMVVFGGEDWLRRGECFTILLRLYASIAPVNSGGSRPFPPVFPGSRIMRAPALPISGAIFAILLLGTGSFDGLNETFWWLAKLGVNPLEFPGRSAIVWQTTIGLLVANILLVAAFVLTVWLGLRLVGRPEILSVALGRLALTLLPIAAAYHVAHFQVAFLVNGQYLLAALNDPFSTGADIFGLEPFYVTTGFLNTTYTVRIIWLSQAFIIVAGHMLAIMLSHAIALDLFKDGRKAIISQIPPAIFMILYTLFGLWLLAAPRGA